MEFDIKASTWDNEKREDRARIIAEEIITAIPINKKRNALEFGCGTGLVSFNLYEKFENITLVDISKGMIEMLNFKIEKHKINNMKAYQMDINQGNFLLESNYDLIYTSMALHHIIDTEITLRNLYKLLKKDGYLCIIDLDEEDGSFHGEEKDFNGHNGFNQKSLRSLLLKIGFKEVEVNTFYNDEKIVKNINVKYSLFLMTGIK